MKDSTSITLTALKFYGVISVISFAWYFGYLSFPDELRTHPTIGQLSHYMDDGQAGPLAVLIGALYGLASMGAILIFKRRRREDNELEKILCLINYKEEQLVHVRYSVILAALEPHFDDE